jgi:alanine-synthesizing transaminase
MFSKRTNWKLSPNPYAVALQQMRAAGRPLIDLTVSNPTQCGFHYDSAQILSAFQNPQALAYEPEAKGLPAERHSVARYYQEDHRTIVDPESVLLTTSTSEAYSYIFRLLCNPQDEILVPKPSYPLFDFLADLQDVTLVPYSLEYAQGWFIDFQSLQSARSPRTRAILLVHPNNPTGSFVHQEEHQRLNQFCREHGLAQIVDEVFLDYSLTDAQPETFAANQDCLTFTLSGLSKIAALPQMKVAWMITTGPDAQKTPAVERLEVIADTYLSLNSVTQHAFATLLAQRRSLQPQILERTRQNWAHLKSAMNHQLACELFDAEAGWYAILKVHGSPSDEDLSVDLLKQTHTLVHPGHLYDFPGDGYLVVSLITPLDDFQRGISALLQFLSNTPAP